MRRHSKVDWIKRRGTVTHVRPYTGEVEVQWDDRRSVDHRPLRALQKVELLR